MTCASCGKEGGCAHLPKTVAVAPVVPALTVCMANVSSPTNNVPSGWTSGRKTIHRLVEKQNANTPELAARQIEEVTNAKSNMM
jgi:hypothetical protein